MIQMIAVDRLIPYTNNSKKHPEEQINHLASMLLEYGFDQPIVVDSNYVVIKGHGRRLAAIKAGIETVPVIVRSDLSQAKIRASRIADNKIAETDWDHEQLKFELDILREENFDLLSNIGFSDDELKKLFQTEETKTDGKSYESKELSEEEFSNFDHQCPKCGFEFDNK